MSVKIDLEIKGIALISPLDADHWKIRFPFEEVAVDECHDIKLSVTRSSDNNLFEIESLASENRRINFLFEYLPPTNTVDDPKLLSMNDPDAHGPGGTKGKPSAECVELVLPKVIFKGLPEDDLQKPLYALFKEKDERYQVRKEPFRITMGVRAEFEVDNGQSIEFNIDGAGSDLYEFQDGEEYSIIFDNDCSVKKNDFRLVYEMIEDAHNKDKKFELEWVPDLIEPYLKKNTQIDKWAFQAIQTLARKFPKANQMETNEADKSLLVRNDPTYPCFVYKSE